MKAPDMGTVTATLNKTSPQVGDTLEVTVVDSAGTVQAGVDHMWQAFVPTQSDPTPPESGRGRIANVRGTESLRLAAKFAGQMRRRGPISRMPKGTASVWRSAAGRARSREVKRLRGLAGKQLSITPTYTGDCA